MNPYFVLGVPLAASDEQIRQAYLDAVKAHPPDHDAEQFQAIHKAYEKIKDETSRYRYELFDREVLGESPVDVYLRFARWRKGWQPLPWKAMKAMLEQYAKSK